MSKRSQLTTVPADPDNTTRRIAELPIPLRDAQHLASWCLRHDAGALDDIERLLRYVDGAERVRLLATRSWSEMREMGARLK